MRRRQRPSTDVDTNCRHDSRAMLARIAVLSSNPIAGRRIAAADVACGSCCSQLDQIARRIRAESRDLKIFAWGRLAGESADGHLRSRLSSVWPFALRRCPCGAGQADRYRGRRRPGRRRVLVRIAPRAKTRLPARSPLRKVAARSTPIKTAGIDAACCSGEIPIHGHRIVDQPADDVTPRAALRVSPGGPGLGPASSTR